VILASQSDSVDAAFEYSHCSSASEALAGALDLFAGAPLDFAAQPALVAESALQSEATTRRLFNLSDFTLSSGAARLRTGSFTFGASTSQLTGSDFYRERSYSLNVAGRVSNSFSLGMIAGYRQLAYTSGYSDLSSTSLGAGLFWQPAIELRLAASLLEINKPKFFAGGESAPRSGVISLAYQFSPDLSWYFTYRVISDLPDRLSLGQSWKLHERVILRLGVRNQPLDICGGLSVGLGGFSFDYTYTNNVYLGGTHMLGLRYER
jgi:hypothetical protein